MAQKALIIAVVLGLLPGCQTIEQRASAAAAANGQTKAERVWPDFPEACAAKVARVVPKVGEKARWTQERWEITADNRDRQAADCDAWWEAYKKASQN